MILLLARSLSYLPMAGIIIACGFAASLFGTRVAPYLSQLLLTGLIFGIKHMGDRAEKTEGCYRGTPCNPRDSWPEATDKPVELGPAAAPIELPPVDGRLYEEEVVMGVYAPCYRRVTVEVMERDQTGKLALTGRMQAFNLSPTDRRPLDKGATVRIRRVPGKWSTLEVLDDA